LLLTCKIIREEAILVFYGAPNRFWLIVHGYDPAVLSLWDTKKKHLKREYNLVPAKYRIAHEGQRAWANLRLALQLHHGRKLRTTFTVSRSSTSTYREEIHFIGGLFKVSRAIRDRPWEEVRGVLDTLRLGLVSLDNEWEL
jgi:hypothetical protein